MRKISKVEPTIPALPTRLRVAAYARVSVEQERTIHSMSAQISYYNELIQKNPEWEFAGVYADLGISGTGINKRDEFKRLIDDCNAGKIDIVLTKSISRFARNTVDLLETVRHLKDLGIEVRFERENISSMSGDGELMISILASFAQEESTSISDNIKWSHRKRAEQGKPSGGFDTYGYHWNGTKFVIEPTEAEVVRLIFSNYLNGIYARETAAQLKEMGVTTCRGNDSFNPMSIQQMLKNEKYTGCMVLQKGYVANPITKKRVKNDGEFPKYYVENCHEAIISKEDFEKVQEIMRTRRELGAIAYDKINTTCFTGKIKCGCCGKNYQRRTSRSTHQSIVKHWQCGLQNKSGKSACANYRLEENTLKSVCAKILETDGFDENTFTNEIEKLIVNTDMSLEFHFYDGAVKNIEWVPPKTISKSERMKGNTYGRNVVWSDERREQQRQRMKNLWRNGKLNAKNNKNTCSN